MNTPTDHKKSDLPSPEVMGLMLTIHMSQNMNKGHTRTALYAHFALYVIGLLRLKLSEC